MANAQDEAFVELGARRGVLPPEVVRAARELRRDVGSDEPLAQLLLAGKLLAPAVVAGLLRDLTRGGFACERCGERARYDGLARLERLACPRCAGPLAFVDPSASDGGPTAPEPPRPTGAHPAVRPTGTYPAAQPSGYHPAARATGTFGAVGPGSGPRATGVHPAARRPSGPLPPPAPPASVSPASVSPASVPPPDAWDAEATVIDKNKRRAQAAAARASVVVDDTLRAPAHEPVDSTVRDGRVLGLPGGGRTIGPYTLLQEIGRGAGGVIFLARRPGLERRFAIKLLLGDMARDEEAVARFKREAAVASKVDDPGIIAVYDTGCDGGRYYYVMEFCPGPTLEARLMDGPMPHDDAVRLVLSLARTVQAAHDRGVVHRDLKPANIIIEEGSGRPRVMDFGVARDVGANAGLSRTGELLGTPAYMAPEQLKGERDVDHRVDVYALGVILFECLAGRRPHVAATTVQLAERVIMEDAPALRTVAPTAPPALELVCRRALARDRAGRYDQARALARDLERYLAGRGVRAPAREGRARDRWTGRLVGAAALALALAGSALGWRAWSDHAAANEAREREAAAAARAERARELAARAAAAREGLFSGRVELARLREEAAALAADPDAGADIRALERAVAAITLARRPEERSSADVLRAVDGAIELARDDLSLQAALHLAAAEHLRRRAQYSQALARVEHALVEGGRLGLEARLLRGVLFGRLGRRSDAAEQFRRLAAEDPEGAPGLLARAAAFEVERPAEASRLAGLAHAAEPHSLLARARLAHAQNLVKEHAQALAEADRCLELAPDDQLCHAIRGIALHGLERRMQALAAFDRAVELGEPQPDPTTLGWRALVRRAESDKHGALRDLDRALELRPDDAELLFLRGIINDELGRTTAAETDWRAAERLDREHVNAQLRAQPHLRQRVRQALGGEAAQQPPPQPPQPQPPPPRQGHSELAARVDARAQRVPEDARAGVREALVRAVRGRPWREIEAALAGVREGPEVHLERARLSLGRDAHAAAEQALAALRAAGGAGPELGRLEGELSLRRGRLSDAERRYRAVAEAEPDHVEGLVALAEAERLRGRADKAAAAVEAALALDPQHTAALVLQAELLLGRDPPEPDAAREVVQRALHQLGLIDSRAVTVELLCIGHQTIRSLTEGDPTSVFRVGGFMREVTVLREVSEGAAPSLALASMILDAQLPGFALQGAQDLFLRARELEPDRPDLHLVQGRLELASVRSRADDVLASWRRARQEPLLRLPPRVVLEFRQRFGPSAELDALLQDR